MIDQPSFDFIDELPPKHLTPRELLERNARRRGPPHQSHSTTSRDAAATVNKARGSLHRELIALLEDHPLGLTDEQMQKLAKMNPSTQRPRRIELVASGFVADAQTTRKTASGRNATVWMVVQCSAS